MVYIAHLRKQFKSTIYVIHFIKRRKNPLSPFWELNGSSFENTWIPFTKGCFVPNMVKIGPMVGRRRFLSFVTVFLPFHNLHTTGKCSEYQHHWLQIFLTINSYCEKNSSLNLFWTMLNLKSPLSGWNVVSSLSGISSSSFKKKPSTFESTVNMVSNVWQHGGVCWKIK